MELMGVFLNTRRSRLVLRTARLDTSLPKSVPRLYVVLTHARLTLLDSAGMPQGLDDALQPRRTSTHTSIFHVRISLVWRYHHLGP